MPSPPPSSVWTKNCCLLLYLLPLGRQIHVASLEGCRCKTTGILTARKSRGDSSAKPPEPQDHWWTFLMNFLEVNLWSWKAILYSRTFNQVFLKVEMGQQERQARACEWYGGCRSECFQVAKALATNCQLSMDAVYAAMTQLDSALLAQVKFEVFLETYPNLTLFSADLPGNIQEIWLMTSTQNTMKYHNFLSLLS